MAPECTRVNKRLAEKIIEKCREPYASVMTYNSGSQTVIRVPLVVREDLQGGTRRDLLSVFLHKKYIHSCSFYLSGSVNKFLNFCVAYSPCCFLKMAIKISHGHFVHVAFVSILVFQTLDRMIFSTLTFLGTRWYVMTVRDTQMVRDQKKFENHWPTGKTIK